MIGKRVEQFNGRFIDRSYVERGSCFVTVSVKIINALQSLDYKGPLYNALNNNMWKCL